MIQFDLNLYMIPPSYGKISGPINHDRLCPVISITKYNKEITYKVENSYCMGNFSGGNAVLA